MKNIGIKSVLVTRFRLKNRRVRVAVSIDGTAHIECASLTRDYDGNRAIHTERIAFSPESMEGIILAYEGSLRAWRDREDGEKGMG